MTFKKRMCTSTFIRTWLKSHTILSFCWILCKVKTTFINLYVGALALHSEGSGEVVEGHQQVQRLLSLYQSSRNVWKRMRTFLVLLICTQEVQPKQQNGH